MMNVRNERNAHVPLTILGVKGHRLSVYRTIKKNSTNSVITTVHTLYINSYIYSFI